MLLPSLSSTLFFSNANFPTIFSASFSEFLVLLSSGYIGFIEIPLTAPEEFSVPLVRVNSLSGRLAWRTPGYRYTRLEGSRYKPFNISELHSTENSALGYYHFLTNLTWPDQIKSLFKLSLPSELTGN